MDRKQASSIRRAVKAIGASCKVITVGTGKCVQVMLEGKDAEAVAAQLVTKGFARGRSFGREFIIQ